MFFQKVLSKCKPSYAILLTKKEEYLFAFRTFFHNFFIIKNIFKFNNVKRGEIVFKETRWEYVKCHGATSGICIGVLVH